MRKWYPAALIAMGLAASAVVYPRLPARVPIHWNLHGQVDGWAGPLRASVLLPTLSLAVWVLLVALPRIDPRRENYAKFRGSYDLVVAATVTLLVGVHMLVLAAGLGVSVPVMRIVPVAIGGLMLVLGNVLPRARPNWWFGIRTPWTLSNDRVWQRTHRVGGYLMMLSGAVLLVSALVPSSAARIAGVGGVLVASLVSYVYSYFAWKQETSQ